MKKLLFMAAIAATLFSCSERDRAIRLSNGSIIRAEVTNDITYNVGNRVCVRKFGIRDWQICSDGEMLDTIITSPIKIVYRTGIVSAYL